jgi:hypothetical protein
MTNDHGQQISKPALFAMSIGVTAVVVMYFCFPCHRYFVDGIMYAIDMRDNPTSWIIHPHHLLYPLLPQFFFKVAGGLATGFTELDFLLVWSMFAGALAAWGLLMALRAGSMSPSAALIGIGFFSFTRAVWYFAVTPNQNSIAFAFQVLALLAIIITSRRLPELPSTRNLVVIGVFTSLAILTSQLNLVLLLPTLLVIYYTSASFRDRFLNGLKFLGITALIALGIYIIIGFTLSGLRSPADFLGWQHSYVYQARWWALGFMDAVERSWGGLITVHVASVFTGNGLFGNWLAGFGSIQWYIHLVIRLAQAYIIGFLIFETVRTIEKWIRDRGLLAVQAIGLASALPIYLFSFAWAPESSNYRVLYIAGFFLFLTPSLEHFYQLDNFRFRKAWPLLLALLCLFSVNFITQFLPQSDPGENPYNYEVFRLSEYVTEGDLIIYSGSDEGHMRGLYVQYFLGCETIMAHEFITLVHENTRSVIDDFEERSAQGHFIYVHEDALYNVEDLEWMQWNYGSDIQPQELRQFLETWNGPLGAGVLINDKQYFRLRPRMTGE